MPVPKKAGFKPAKAAKTEATPITPEAVRALDKQMQALSEQISAFKFPTLPEYTFVPCRRMDVLLDISSSLGLVQEDPDENVGLIYRLAAFLVAMSMRPKVPVLYRGNWQDCADYAVELLAEAGLSFQEVINLGTPLIAHATLALSHNTHEVQEIKRSTDFLSLSKEG